MARTDAIVLGAGIVGTSAALHLAKRGLAVALVDRRGPGEETSYGNAGVIEGNTLFPHAFPSGFGALLRIALKQAPEANYHLSFLPKVAPWLLAYRSNTRAEGSLAFAEAMRPLFSRAVSEHEALMAESGATRYLRKDGWLKLYRSDEAFAATARERELAADARPHPARSERRGSARARAVARAGVPPRRALAGRRQRVQSARGHQGLCGAVHRARRRHRSRATRGRCIARAQHWRVDTDEGPIDAKDVVVALGPWAPDLLGRLGIELPLAFKRGYHRHFRPRGNAGLTRPVVDTDERLLPRADGAGHPAHHRRGIRRPRRGADAGAVRPAAAGGARAVSAGRGASRRSPGWDRGRALPIPGR